MKHKILDISPDSYQASFIHTQERDWAETNCYVDIWIELLHAMGKDPRSALAYTLAIDLNDKYAEAYYNRGLALLLQFDRAAGCEDLTKAEELGFKTATEKKKYFCSKQIDLPLINY